MGGGARRGRAASLAKREQGLKKKASELATLCGVDVCLLGVDPDGNYFFWPDDISEFYRIAHRYLDAVGGGDRGREVSGGQQKRKRAPAMASSRALRSAPPRKKQERGSQSRAIREVYEAEGSNGVGFAFDYTDDYLDKASSYNTMSSPSPLLAHNKEPLRAADIGSLTCAAAVVPLPTSVASSYTGPAAVELDDGEGDVGEDLLCLLNSPTKEESLLYDLGPLPMDFPIREDVLQPRPAPADALEAAYAPSAAWMHLGLLETADSGRDAPAIPTPSPPADPPVHFGFYGADPLGLAAELGLCDGVEAISQLPCFASSYHSLDPHFIMY